jgi:hypothetical protein
LGVVRSDTILQKSNCKTEVSNAPSLTTGINRLIVLQVIMPNISFAGHLAGILAGTLQLNGCPMTPSDAALCRLDDSAVVRRLTLMPSFVATTSVSIGSNNNNNDTASIGFAGCSTVWKYTVLAGESISAALFGRGHAENANIRLGRANEGGQVGLIPKDASPDLSQIV